MYIEGAEVMLVRDEPEVFTQCRMIIAELHEASIDDETLTVTKLENFFKSLGYREIASRGPVYVFLRDK